MDEIPAHSGTGQNDDQAEEHDEFRAQTDESPQAGAREGENFFLGIWACHVAPSSINLVRLVLKFPGNIDSKELCGFQIQAHFNTVWMKRSHG